MVAFLASDSRLHDRNHHHDRRRGQQPKKCAVIRFGHICWKA